MPARARQVDPNPRDPGTSSSSAPSRPRPPRDPQPRDDGANRSMHAAFATMSLSGPFSGNLVLTGDPDPPEGPNPRDPGKKKRLALRRSDDDDEGESGASPRDPGRRVGLNAAAASAAAARSRSLSSESQHSPQTSHAVCRRIVLSQQPRDAGY